MSYSCKLFCISLCKKAQIFLNFTPCKKKKRHRLSSNLDFVSSSFAAMEVSSQFKQVFKAIDANRDGKISSMELSEMLICFGCEKSTAVKEAEGMVREMDRDGDGFVDLDEFIHAVSSDGEDCNDGKEDHLMDAFLMFDSDKNGLISAEELRRVLIGLGFDRCSLRECERMIRGVDKDGDGFVDFEDFRSMMTNSRESKSRASS
ncbi:hypothetical protein SLE2022_026740 [Rubroshorea leprosula]